MNIHDMNWLPEQDGDMFGRRVAAWLAMHRITHADLATATSIDKSGLFRALNGKRPFPVSLAIAVSHYTGLPLTGDTVTYNPDRARDSTTSNQASERTSTPAATDLHTLFTQSVLTSAAPRARKAAPRAPGPVPASLKATSTSRANGMGTYRLGEECAHPTPAPHCEAAPEPVKGNPPLTEPFSPGAVALP